MKAKTTIKTETISAKITKETKAKIIKIAKKEDRKPGFIVARMLDAAVS